MNVNWGAYWRLMRFDRPIGILLLLWPTWWSLLIAGDGAPRLKTVIIFTAGVILMRAAGCISNDVADRDFDPHVERTRTRPLASGELTLKQALTLFFILMLLAFGLVLLTNPLTIKLAFVGALLASTYPLFKRFTHFPQVVLGTAFGWACVMSFSAETGQVPWPAWWLLGINVVWSVIYDTLYAMVDRDDDISIGVKSTAIFFGHHDLKVIFVLMLLMCSLLIALGYRLQMTWPYYLGVAGVASLFAQQLWMSRGRTRDGCFRSFLNNNWVGMVVFLGLVGHYAVTGKLGLS